MTNRLELTWVNKDLPLLSDGDGGYVWADRTDPNVDEVRALREVSRYGDATGSTADNLIISGDNRHSLRTLVFSPEYSRFYRGKISLAYLDPPFNTGQAFEQYDDALEHSVWLSMMRERLSLIRELLADDGTVWVHLDDQEMAYCRALLDEIFGRACFVATIIWQKADSVRMDALQFSSSHDLIHVYSKTPGWAPNPIDSGQEVDTFVEEGDELSGDESGNEFPYSESDGRRFKSSPLRKWGKNSRRQDRPNLWYSITSPDGIDIWPVKPDGTEGNWRWKREKVAADSDLIQWIDKGSGLQPYVKSYEGRVSRPAPPPTLWLNTDVGHNRSAKAHLKRIVKDIYGPGHEVFATPKPEPLLHRIVATSTKPGDVVLDSFGGSGTTAAVAHKMGRRWVTCEAEDSTISTFLAPRLELVVAGAEPGGVTKQTGWQGGGGFRILSIAPSIYIRHGSSILLADDLDSETLAISVAGQLGFEPIEDATRTFCGVRGKARLSVINGAVDTTVVRSLVSRLMPDERLVVVGRNVMPDASVVLSGLRPGSRVFKAPQDLIQRRRVVK